MWQCARQARNNDRDVHERREQPGDDAQTTYASNATTRELRRVARTHQLGNNRLRAWVDDDRYTTFTLA
jgi:hypothetical protein